jgi:DNA helicase-2/ATP-dependent DNA helicase PcrA
MEWQIPDQDIQTLEELLLPHGAQFPEDARRVIRCWHSTDVAACPGSGKTTVLLAKLKLLADKMPLENGAGICVLSHTNVAINEIKKPALRLCR